MATKTVKSRPGGPKVTVTKRPPKARTETGTAAVTETGSKTGRDSARQAPAPEENKGAFLKRTVLPSAACGVLLGAVAMQEGADLPIAALVTVCMTGVITGMIKLKNALYGN